jgi:hypothetical protein
VKSDQEEVLPFRIDKGFVPMALLDYMELLDWIAKRSISEPWRRRQQIAVGETHGNRPIEYVLSRECGDSMPRPTTKAWRSANGSISFRNQRCCRRIRGLAFDFDSDRGFHPRLGAAAVFTAKTA